MIRKGIVIISIISILIIAYTIGCVENSDDEDIILTVNFEDYSKEYSLNELKSIDDYSGTGRIIKSKLLPDTVEIEESINYSGVRMNKLLEEIPDLPNNYSINVISSDDYIKTFTKENVEGNVYVYNEEGIVLPNETAVMIIAYKENGEYYSDFDPNNEIGPLRIAFVEDNVITASNQWSKMVVSIEIISV